MSTRTSLRERGAAAVEFALILPVLVLLVGGIVDYGRFFFTQVQLTNAAREGARAGIAQATTADVIARTTTAGGATPGWQTPVPSGDCAATPSGNYTVTTSATFQFFFVNFLPGVPSSTTVTSSATMRC